MVAGARVGVAVGGCAAPAEAPVAEAGTVAAPLLVVAGCVVSGAARVEALVVAGAIGVADAGAGPGTMAEAS